MVANAIFYVISSLCILKSGKLFEYVQLHTCKDLDWYIENYSMSDFALLEIFRLAEI